MCCIIYVFEINYKITLLEYILIIHHTNSNSVYEKKNKSKAGKIIYFYLYMSKILFTAKTHLLEWPSKFFMTWWTSTHINRKNHYHILVTIYTRIHPTTQFILINFIIVLSIDLLSLIKWRFIMTLWWASEDYRNYIGLFYYLCNCFTINIIVLFIILNFVSSQFVSLCV